MPIERVEGLVGCTCHHPELVNLYGCSIGEGTKIGAFVEIGAGVTIGKNCKIQSHVFIPPGVTIGNDVFIGPRVAFCNVKWPDARTPAADFEKTTVMDGAVIGAGAVILPGVRIGQDAIVGAGAVVTKNVPDCRLVYGNPAR
jgi:UDP-2-acetamido-3-amino-2,3-dideoxy-glucuronate N-acetyltransferase